MKEKYKFDRDIINVLGAEKKIRPYIINTPLIFSESVSKLVGASIYFKCENYQHSGSFKIRGVLNKILSLTDEQKKRGLVAASTGNHGIAVAYALSMLKLPGIIFTPETTSPYKISKIRSYGQLFETYGDDCAKTELYAKEYAESRGMTYISPYDDIEVIAGQGTVVMEIESQIEVPIDAIFLPVCGAGLFSGVASYLASHRSATRCVACSAKNTAAMYESVKVRKVVDVPLLPSLSDATRGGIVPGCITLDFCAELVDDFILVTESEIERAMKIIYDNHQILVEGAAALPLAAIFKIADQYQGRSLVAVISGGNINQLS